MPQSVKNYVLRKNNLILLKQKQQQENASKQLKKNQEWPE